MMTYEEAKALPIPKEYEDTPNIYRLNCVLNSCKNPRLVYNALMALAPVIREARTAQQRAKLLEDLKEDAR